MRKYIVDFGGDIIFVNSCLQWYVVVRMEAQFGINSTSVFWKFCQNWTSCRGESNLAKFSNITSTINPELYEQHRMITYTYLFIIGMTKLHTST